MNDTLILKTDVIAPYAAGNILAFNESITPKISDLNKKIDSIIQRVLQAKVDEKSYGKWGCDFGKVKENRVQGWSIVGYWQSITTKPTWLSEVPEELKTEIKENLAERTVNLILSLSKPPYYFLHCSDLVIRKQILISLLTEVTLEGKYVFQQISENIMSNAFLRGEAKQLWLRGVHRKTRAKPDSKNIAGTDLRSSINPFEDQTFKLNAAVSDWKQKEIEESVRYTDNLPQNSALRQLPEGDAITRAPKKNDKIGISLVDSFLWTKQAKVFKDFVDELDKLTQIISTTKNDADKQESVGFSQRGYRNLSRPSFDIDKTKLGCPIDFNIELLSTTPEYVEKHLEKYYLACQSWQEKGEFIYNSVDEERLFIDALFDNNKLARIRVQPVLLAGGSVEFNYTTEATIEQQNQTCFSELDEILKHLNENLSIWYEKGFVIIQKQIFKLEFRDVPFNSWKWLPLTNLPVRYLAYKEKPKDLYASKWNDSSLFELVIKNIENIFGKSSDWCLISDDGSGEVSDFIYIDSQRKQLKLLHLKGSGKSSEREVAPAKYEVVIAQAEKNLRFLDVAILQSYLRNTRGKKIEGLTWINGKKESDRSGVVKAIDNLGNFPHREVIVFQPHVTKKAWDQAENALRTDPSMSIAKKVQLLRLKTLLATIEQTCRNLSTEFSVWSDGTGESDQFLLFPSSRLT